MPAVISHIYNKTPVTLRILHIGERKSIIRGTAQGCSRASLVSVDFQISLVHEPGGSYYHMIDQQVTLPNSRFEGDYFAAALRGQQAAADVMAELERTLPDIYNGEEDSLRFDLNESIGTGREWVMLCAMAAAPISPNCDFVASSLKNMSINLWLSKGLERRGKDSNKAQALLEYLHSHLNMPVDHDEAADWALMFLSDLRNSAFLED